MIDWDIIFSIFSGRTVYSEGAAPRTARGTRPAARTTNIFTPGDTNQNNKYLKEPLLRTDNIISKWLPSVYDFYDKKIENEYINSTGGGLNNNNIFRTNRVAQQICH